MAVFTKLKLIDIKKIIHNYDIGKLEKFHGIKEGIENTNYFIKTSKQKLILTIFEKRVRKQDVPFFVNLMEMLNKKKLNAQNLLEIKIIKQSFKLIINQQLLCLF